MTDLTSLLTAAATAPSHVDALLEHMLKALEAKRPAVAEAVRLCAVPRRFDADVVGVLTGKPEDCEELLDRLRRLTFVTRRANGDHVYQDSVRQLLLDRWRSQEPDRLDALHASLTRYYAEQHDRAVELERDLLYARPVLQAADPARSATVTSVVERRLIAPMTEGLYHAASRSATSGYAQFAAWFERYEHEGRFSICQALLEAERQFLGERSLHPGGEDEVERWMSYWLGRLMRRQGRRATAEQQLRAVLADSEADLRLRIWTLSELGAVLEERYDIHGALAAYTEEVELSERSSEDRFNLAVPYCRLARLKWLLGDLDAARDHYGKAIGIADEVGNVRLAILARLDHSGVELDAGDFPAGRDAALEALRRARLERTTDRPTALRVAERFLTVFARRSAALLEAVAHEGCALAGGSENPDQLRDFRALHAEMQLAAGDAHRARESLEDLCENADSTADAASMADLALQAAAVAEDLGELDDALRRYSELIATHGDDPASAWRTASALSRRGALQMMRGEFAAAEEDLNAAVRAWAGLGHERYAGLASLDIAAVRLRQGRFDDVQAIIDEARRFDDPETSAKRLEVLGDLHRAGGRWAQADDAYADAAAVNAALCRHRSQARLLGRGAEVAGALSQWQTAADRLADATDALQLLGRLTEGVSPDSAQPNLDGARGILCLVGGEDRRRLMRARDHFTAAGRHAHGTAWHLLNAAYAHALLEEWDDAAAQLEHVFAAAPDWLRSPVLERDLTEFRDRASRARG